MPFGFAVVPDVYNRYRSCSESTGTGVHASGCRSTMSGHHTSRPAVIDVSTASPSRRATRTCSIEGALAIASSAAGLRGVALPLRQPPSAVIRTFASASLIRPARASAEKPPKTTVWAAPSRAQASIAIGNSGIIGI